MWANIGQKATNRTRESCKKIEGREVWLHTREDEKGKKIHVKETRGRDTGFDTKENKVERIRRIDSPDRIVARID